MDPQAIETAALAWLSQSTVPGETFKESIALLYGGYVLAVEDPALTVAQFTALLARTYRVTQSSLVWGVRIAPIARRALLAPKIATQASQFVKQCCVTGPPLSANVTVAAAHAAYTQWAGQLTRVSGVKRFTREMKAQGFDVRRKPALGGATIMGVALTDEWTGRVSTLVPAVPVADASPEGEPVAAVETAPAPAQ